MCIQRYANLPVFFLTSCIQYIQESGFMIDDTLLAIGIYRGSSVLHSVMKYHENYKWVNGYPTFDCGVIFINKVWLNELNSECRLAHTYREKKKPKSDALDIGLYLVIFSFSHSVEQGYTKIVMIFKLKSFLHWNVEGNPDQPSGHGNSCSRGGKRKEDDTLPPPPTTTTLYSLRNDALDMAGWMCR